LVARKREIPNLQLTMGELIDEKYANEAGWRSLHLSNKSKNVD
jgi:hypothetical protein